MGMVSQDQGISFCKLPGMVVGGKSTCMALDQWLVHRYSVTQTVPHSPFLLPDIFELTTQVIWFTPDRVSSLHFEIKITQKPPLVYRGVGFNSLFPSYSLCMLIWYCSCREITHPLFVCARVEKTTLHNIYCVPNTKILGALTSWFAVLERSQWITQRKRTP